MNSFRKPIRKAIIREEYLELTKDLKLAIILNQLAFWTYNGADRDDWYEEENKRARSEYTNVEKLKFGWICKKVEKIAHECLIDANQVTMGKYMSKLVSMGLISRRYNKRDKQDRTYEYRVMLLELEKQLSDIGYRVPLDHQDGKRNEEKKTTIRLAECGHVHVKRYAELYSEYKDRAHPNLKHEQYERACKWFDDVQAEFNLFDDQVEDMIHCHFENLPKSNDGNINAFATGDVAQGPHRKYIGK